jgi:hypothetical protein
MFPSNAFLLCKCFETPCILHFRVSAALNTTLSTGVELLTLNGLDRYAYE